VREGIAEPRQIGGGADEDVRGVATPVQSDAAYDPS
jgi:hypothetical protein